MPHTSTVLSERGVGLEPLFCLGFWHRGSSRAGGGGGGVLTQAHTNGALEVHCCGAPWLRWPCSAVPCSLWHSALVPHDRWPCTSHTAARAAPGTSTPSPPAPCPQFSLPLRVVGDSRHEVPPPPPPYHPYHALSSLASLAQDLLLCTVLASIARETCTCAQVNAVRGPFLGKPPPPYSPPPHATRSP